MSLHKQQIKRVLIASGAFKDVFTPQEACAMIAKGMRDVLSHEVDIELQPMVDGGECSSDVLSACLGYEKKRVLDLVDPVGHAGQSEYVQIDDDTVFIATSSVMALPPIYGDEFRNPLLLTSYGFGQMIKEAHRRGAKNIIVGFGGTSTVDGGLGMLQALGAAVEDKNGRPLVPSSGGAYYTGADLAQVGRINCDGVCLAYHNLSIKALCDTTISVRKITIPTALKVGKYYEQGKAKIVQDLEAALLQFSYLIEGQEFAKIILRQWPGGERLVDKNFFGVAGGVLMGMISIFHVTPVLGVDYFIDLFKIDEKVRRADLVVSGEGRFDISLTGKTPSGIARIAQKHHKPFVCVCGTVSDEFKTYFNSGICRSLPEQIEKAGLSIIMSCHPEYTKEAVAKSYHEEMAYYRNETPKILLKRWGEFFNNADGISS